MVKVNKKIVLILISCIILLNITGCKDKTTKNEVINKKEQQNIETKEKIDDSDNSKTEEKTNEETNVKEEKAIESTPDLNTSEKIEQPVEEPQEEVPSCTTKKFDNIYSYVYSTHEECKSNGYTVFDNVSQNVDDSLFSFGCSEIVDECGTTWYGVYFNRYSDGEVIKVYY